MEAATHPRATGPAVRRAATEPAPIPVSLDRETRAALPTREAAYHLGRKEQTLRGWACLESGPIRPIRVHGRLAWPTAEIRRLLGVQ